MNTPATVNRQWLLARRPQGRVQLADFAYREQPFTMPELADGEILLAHRVFSCAPTMRNFMNEPGRSYRASVPLGTPVTGIVGSDVIASRNPRYPAGSRVCAVVRWEDYSVVNPDRTEVPVYRVAEDVELMEMMGPLSLNALTAYFGLFEIAKIARGETVLVSGAAGSVGSMACQIAKIAGCRVIAIAGGAQKCAWLRDELRVDAAIDYKSEDVRARLKALCPDGIHAFFDNVGGDILDAAVDNMAVRGRIALCGQVSAYDSDQPAPGPHDMMKVVYRQLRLEGFVLGRFAARVEEGRRQLLAWLREGRIGCRMDVRRGFESLPATFMDLFTGANQGTLVVLNDNSGEPT